MCKTNSYSQLTNYYSWFNIYIYIHIYIYIYCISIYTYIYIYIYTKFTTTISTTSTTMAPVTKGWSTWVSASPPKRWTNQPSSPGALSTSSLVGWWMVILVRYPMVHTMVTWPTLQNDSIRLDSYGISTMVTTVQ